MAARVFANLGHTYKYIGSAVREVRVFFSTLQNQNSLF